MKLNDLKISTQLKVALTTIVLFVAMQGTLAYLQSGKLQQLSEDFYGHPYSTRNNIGKLRLKIDVMQIALRDLILANKEKDKLECIQTMETATMEAQQQFELLKTSYLGHSDDIDDAQSAFIQWKTSRDETIKSIQAGKPELAKKDIGVNGTVKINRDRLVAVLGKIDQFAIKKAEEFQRNSINIHTQTKLQLGLTLLAILLLSIMISIILIRNIRNPLTVLIETTQRFKDGDWSARSSYRSGNEYGVLSDSINALNHSLQSNMEQEKKLASLADLMLGNYEIKEFFREILLALASNTNAANAAVYRLDDTKKTYHHFVSIGLDQQARQSFSAENLEGEFGAVLIKKEIQHIKNIPTNSRFIFHSVTGAFIPQEILTIPIIAQEETIAIISLANLGSFTKESIELINHILFTLSARIEGISAANKMINLTKTLAIQNQELETKEAELHTLATELLAQNTLLEHQKKQVQEVSRLKTNFLSNMSHELRTPLNSVIALSGVLGRRLVKKIPEDEYSYLEVIERNGKHLLSLINDILDLSRIESGKEEMMLTEININSLIADMVSMIQPQAMQQNIQLVYNIPDSPILMISDSSKLRHILQNLIGNAVKFTEVGKVEVSITATENKVRIKITDTGIGISEDSIPHIFDEFRQADGSTSRKFGGSGLGLAIAKKYATLLGGEINAKSTLGYGSEFELIVPLRPANANEIIQPVTNKYRPYSNPITAPKKAINATLKTILLVEDSEPAIIQLNDVLDENGYQVLIARNGKEALDTINNTMPDAIILDLMMPGMDGFEVLKTIRSNRDTGDIPVLILTAKHITKEELSFLSRNHIHQYIQKGDVNLKELLQAVNAMVDENVMEPTHDQKTLQKIDGKPTLLIVEDNTDNMITMKALLAHDFILLEDTDGLEGLALIKKHQPNLVLMDIALPGIDGIEALKEIRSDDTLKNIPIVAVSASALQHDQETILSQGFDGYISKPLDAPLLLETINYLLYGKQNN